MKVIIELVALLTVATQAYAVKPCEELKAEIAARLDAKQVKNYTLEIVENDKTGDKKIVGTCDGGTKKIVYEKQK